MEQREFSIKYDVDAKPILPGAPIVLRQGEKVRVISSVGGYFSVQRSDGQVVKVPWQFAPALDMDLPKPWEIIRPPGEEAPAPAPAPTKSEASTPLENAVWDALSTCYDPEIPANIVDLGLIYGVDIHPFPGGGSSVTVRMTLTAPGCEMAEEIRYDAEYKVKGLPGVSDARVEVVFDPPWTADRMSEAAKLQLGMF